MKTTQLISNFVDGSASELAVDFTARLVRLEVNDEESRQRYDLEFAECALILFQLSEIEGPEDSDLDNLFEIKELSSIGDVRVFQIEFSDDSHLTIHCREFQMKPIPGFWLHANPPTD